jgi:glycosyltransferase involved in cell wall biosynthesis
MEHPEVGTTSKIKAEIETLRKMGYKVYYTAYVTDGVAIFDNADREVVRKKVNNHIAIISKVKLTNSLVAVANEYLKKNKFDFCLVRLNVFTKKYVRMLKQMKNDSFVMMESLSYFPDMKYSDVKGFGYFLYLASIKRNKKQMKDYVDLMLTEGIIENYYGVPCVEFGMGIDVDNYKEHQYTGDLDELNLIMVGCNSVYHGTDRILRSMLEYYKKGTDKRIVKLHLVGDLLPKDHELTQNEFIRDKVFTYGRQHGKKLDEIFEKANIALGPLAQFRMKKKDTGLKTKEYMARGIPYIYSGNEIQIEEEYPYIMQISDDEEMINVLDIFAFYDRIKEDMECANNMRRKAQEAFEWAKIFERVFVKAGEVGGVQ